MSNGASVGTAILHLPTVMWTIIVFAFPSILRCLGTAYSDKCT